MNVVALRLSARRGLRALALAVAVAVVAMVLTVAAQPYRDATGHPTPTHAELTSASGQLVVGSVRSTSDAGRHRDGWATLLRALVAAVLLASVALRAGRRQWTPLAAAADSRLPTIDRGAVAPRAPPLLLVH